MYKLLTSSQQTSQLMYGFEESTTIRKQELTNNKTEKGTFFVRIKLKDLFGFVDQEKINYVLGYTLTLNGIVVMMLSFVPTLWMLQKML